MKTDFLLVVLLALALVGCAMNETGDDQNEVQVAEWGNLTCPVMRSVAVDKNFFMIFEGKKVYFSSRSSMEEFSKNPEAYRAELMSASGK